MAKGGPDQKNPGECFDMIMRPFCIFQKSILVFDFVSRYSIGCKFNAPWDVAHLAISCYFEISLGLV